MCKFEVDEKDRCKVTLTWEKIISKFSPVTFERGSKTGSMGNMDIPMTALGPISPLIMRWLASVPTGTVTIYKMKASFIFPTPNAAQDGLLQLYKLEKDLKVA